jgi:hypothetical protein
MERVFNVRWILYPRYELIYQPRCRGIVRMESINYYENKLGSRDEDVQEHEDWLDLDTDAAGLGYQIASRWLLSRHHYITLTRIVEGRDTWSVWLGIGSNSQQLQITLDLPANEIGTFLTHANTY